MKEAIYKRVQQNMLMNEHIIEQQIHIWRIIVLIPEFFYPMNESYYFQILTDLRHIGTRSAGAFANRELYLKVLNVITAFAIRSKREGVPATEPSFSETSRGPFIRHITIQACRIVLISSMYPLEQSLCRRGFDLIQTILTLKPHTPLVLKELDDLFPFYNKTLMFYKETEGTSTGPSSLSCRIVE